MKPLDSTFLPLILSVILAQGSVSTAEGQAPTQAPSTETGAREIPRTPDGHPDLQGNWTNETATPFEREEGREPVFTREEVAQIEQGEEVRFLEGQQASDPDRAPPVAGGDVGNYNNVWFARGDRVAIVNGEPRTSLITRPPDGRRPTLTSEGERRAREYREFRGQFDQHDHPELLSLGVRCVISFGSSAGPPMIPNRAYNNNYSIVQTPDHVLIMTEMVHDVRVIRLGDPKPLPDHVRPWFGDSWGRWEGDALVVETSNFNPDQVFRGVPPSEALKVIERFTRVDDETMLYEFTIDDPTTYTSAWGGEVPFKRLNDQVYEYACHEGNYSLSGILSGARYQEREQAQEPR